MSAGQLRLSCLCVCNQCRSTSTTTTIAHRRLHLLSSIPRLERFKPTSRERGNNLAYMYHSITPPSTVPPLPLAIIGQYFCTGLWVTVDDLFSLIYPCVFRKSFSHFCITDLRIRLVYSLRLNPAAQQDGYYPSAKSHMINHYSNSSLCSERNLEAIPYLLGTVDRLWRIVCFCPSYCSTLYDRNPFVGRDPACKGNEQGRRCRRLHCVLGLSAQNQRVCLGLPKQPGLFH